MTTGLSYDGSVAGTTSYKGQIATMAVVEESNAEFLAILPQAITYAENRICRDLDFLFTSVSNSSYSVAANTRTITIPSASFYPSEGGTLVVSEQINLLTPAGSTNPETSTRVPLLPTTKEFLDAVYGGASSVGTPKYFAPFGDGESNYTFLVGPYADATYTVEIIGTYRPSSLSSANVTTFISLNLPDLFIMASMVYVAAYQRNFSSSQGNDPQMPVTYETQYQTLLKSAIDEENRKKFEAAAWSSQSRSASATPTRG
jgi:hypothetical protein